MKSFKKILLTFLTSISAFTFTSCNNSNVNPNPNPDTNTDTDKDDEKTFVDYTTKDEARLKLDYTGRSFLKDGVSQVDLKTSIDGDTAHFTEVGGSETIKCRFYGIDTPESTGKVQPWGKAASNFTKEK